MRTRIRTLAALALALGMWVMSVQAQQPTTNSALDPAAVRALDAMSGYLRNLKSFQVESATTTDVAQDDGQLIQYTSKVNFLVQMPNKLMADQSSDRSERRYVLRRHHLHAVGAPRRLLRDRTRAGDPARARRRAE